MESRLEESNFYLALTLKGEQNRGRQFKKMVLKKISLN